MGLQRTDPDWYEVLGEKKTADTIEIQTTVCLTKKANFDVKP